MDLLSCTRRYGLLDIRLSDSHSDVMSVFIYVFFIFMCSFVRGLVLKNDINVLKTILFCLKSHKQMIL